ncbi:MAG: hypothetical protein A2147_07425 [Chloroflexi bacterium RBG_16_57_8]|nr:MAG: hypothetical protein A2147_07425 [Chloroflexi bacterium RBG_16_57_8]
MEVKVYIQSQLEGLKRGSGRALKDLTQAEYMWRPSCGCNSIGLILFHVARSEDMFVQQRLRQKPQVWESGKWFLKLNMAENEAGSHYTIDQVNAFPVPDAKDLLAYYDEVRANTVEYLASLKQDDFDRKLTILPFPGETTVAAIFSLVVMHSAGHFGEISYLRGLQRGMDK